MTAPHADPVEVFARAWTNRVLDLDDAWDRHDDRSRRIMLEYTAAGFQALRDAGYEIVRRDQRRDELTKAARAVLDAVRIEPAYDAEIAERAGIRTVRPAETAAKHLRALQQLGLVEKVAGHFCQEKWRLSSPTTEG